MERPSSSQISKSRRLYQNPYAHLEDVSPDHESYSPERVAASRSLLQNPCAHMENEERFSSEHQAEDAWLSRPLSHHTPSFSSALTSLPKKNAYKFGEIDERVRLLQRELWKNRQSLWSDNVPEDPVDALDPTIAMRILGFELKLQEGLGKHQTSQGRIEIAGIIDGSTKTVHISRQHDHNVRAFTSAHELGHAALHDFRVALHRDKPLEGSAPSRDPIEREADRFATCFLMPEKLMRQRFQDTFKSDHFQLTDETAFALTHSDLLSVRRKFSTRRKLARLLAKTDQYDGKRFPSLAQQFKVSIETMAIRLEELQLL